MAKSGEISGDKSADNVYLMNHAEHIAMICQSGKVFKFSHIILSKQMQASFHIKMYEKY